MPKIKVNTNGLESFSQRLSGIQGSISSIEEAFRNASSNLDYEIKAKSSISARLSDISSRLQEQCQGVSDMAAFMSKSKELYDTVDTKNKQIDVDDPGKGTYTMDFSPIKNRTTVDFSPIKNRATIDFSPIENPEDGCFKYRQRWDDNFIVQAGKNYLEYVPFGEIGIGFVDSILGINDTHNSILNKQAPEILVVGAKAFKNFAKIAKAGGDSWDVLKPGSKADASDLKALFGSSYNSEVVKIVGEAGKGKLGKGIAVFKNEFSDGISGFYKTPLGAISTVAFFADSAARNYRDYANGEMSGIRMVTETASEFALGLGKDIAIGAAVTAVAATAGAPVVVAALATAGINVGLDWVAKKATGGQKDFTEAVSDLFLDGMKSAFNTLSEHYQKQVSGRSDAQRVTDIGPYLGSPRMS